MENRFTRGQFVHVVATVNLREGTGEILYVNPTTTAPALAAPNKHGVELQALDANGRVLVTNKPQVLFEGRHDDPLPRAGLVSADLPFVPGMQEVRLLINGQVASRHVAGAMDPLADAAIVLGGPPPDSPNRRTLSAPPEARRGGVTYTVQARAQGQAAWQTLAIGRSTPDVEVDVNQFPQADKIRVRVLMTNGFEQRLVAEREIVVGTKT